MATTPPSPPTSTAESLIPALPPEFAQEGLRVILTPIPGVTKPNLMNPDGFHFQCPPLEEFATDYAFAHSEYDTVLRGQFSRKGGRQLRTVSFDTLLVDQGNFTVFDEDIEIERYARRLVRICESGDPFLLTVAHALPMEEFENTDEALLAPELQMEATLRSIKVAEKAGEGDARYLNVAFVEYREPFAVRHTRRRPPRRPRFTDFPRAVLLRHGGDAIDRRTNKKIAESPGKELTLHRLARVYYQNPNIWRRIASHRNQIKNWGPSDPLVDYFRKVKHVRDWPVKIIIPEKSDVGYRRDE